VGEQVPIVTSETSDTIATTTSNRTVQYKDTGVILNVTPRINYDGIIIIEIDQQVSSVKDQVTGGIDSPTISTKSVKTKLAVKDGQSILMGGLISKETTDNESGIPFLKDIPYLGVIFKHQSENTTKKELLIMVTPYVIDSEDVLDQYIRSFKDKMGALRTGLEK
jgi:general secretion pathway protein D